MLACGGGTAGARPLIAQIIMLNYQLSKYRISRIIVPGTMLQYDRVATETSFFLVCPCLTRTGTRRVGDYDGGRREGARLLLRQAEGHRAIIPSEKNVSPIPYPTTPPECKPQGHRVLFFQARESQPIVHLVDSCSLPPTQSRVLHKARGY